MGRTNNRNLSINISDVNFTGSFTGTFIGDGSGLTGVTATLPSGTVSGSIQISYPDISNIPSGLVSGSSQVDANTITNFDTNVLDYINIVGVISGSVAGTDITSLNTFTSSIQNEVDGLSNVTSSYLTTLPTGIVSGSSQLTGSYDVRYTLSGSVQETILPSGTVSGSSQISYPLISNIPSGIISGSSQLPSGILSGSHTDITSLNTFSGSIQTQVNGLSSATSSYLTSLPSGIVSGSSQLTSSYDTRYELSGSSITLPSGTVSGSSQISYTGITDVPAGIISGSSQLPSGILSGSHTDITNLNTFTSSIQDEVDGLSSATSSYLTTVAYTDLTSIPAGIISSSAQITDFEEIASGTHTLVSGSSQLTSSYDTRYTISGSVVSSTLPDGVVSGSSQINLTQTTNYVSGIKTQLDNNAVISGSSTLAGTTNTTAYTPTADYHVATKAYVDNSISGSGGYTDELAQDAVGGILTNTSTISFSYDDTNALISASVIESGLSISSSQIVDLVHTDITSLNTFTSSIQTEVDGLSNATSSYLTSLPSGLLSGSHTDITSLNSFSSSIQSEVDGISQATSSYLTTVAYTDLTSIPSGIVSGSSQVSYVGLSNIPVGILSGSHTDITSLNSFSSSIQTEVDGLSSATSSYLTTVAYNDLTSIPAGIISGSEQLPSGLLSGSHTDITSLNSFTSSIQTEVDGISQATSSYLLNTTDTLTGNLTVTGTITAQEFHTTFISSSVIYGSGSTKFGDSIDDTHEFTGSVDISGSLTALTFNGDGSGLTNLTLPSGILSGSHTDITSLNTFTSSIQDEVDGLSNATSSYLTELPGGILSGSHTDITSLNSYTSSNDTTNTTQNSRLDQLSTVTGSLSTTYEQKSSGTHTLISGSSQLTSSLDTYYTISGSISPLPSGVVSGSSQIDVTQTTNYSGINQYTDTDNLDYMNSIGVVSGSITHYTDSDTLSYINSISVLSGSKTNITSLNTFSSSIQSEVDGLSNATSSYLTTLPSGIVSGSSQLDGTTINNLTGSFSGSFQGDGSALTGITSTVPSGTVSGSSQINYPDIGNIPSGIVSGSSQLSGSFVTKSGTPISGSIGVYIGDGPLQGTSTLTYDGSNLTFTGGFIGTGDSTLSTNGSANLTPRKFGFTDLTTGEAASIQFGDTANTIQTLFGEGIVMRAYNTLVLHGGAATIPALDMTATNYINGTTESLRLLTVHSKKIVIKSSNATSRTQPFLEIQNNAGSVLAGVNSSGQWTGDGSQLTGVTSTVPSGTVSGSSQISYPLISNIPANIVSGSDQVSGSFVQSNLVGTISGSDKVLNMVSLTQSEYDLGSPTADTVYIITDATGSALGFPVELGYAISAEIGNLVTGSAVLSFRMPHSMLLTEVRADTAIAPSGSTIIVDIFDSGTSILSTKLSIDSEEDTSVTAVSQHVIASSSLADNTKITVDITQVGSGTTGSGLKLLLKGYRT